METPDDEVGSGPGVRRPPPAGTHLGGKLDIG